MLVAVAAAAAAAAEEEENRRYQIKRVRLEQKILRDISDPFDVSEEYFRLHYRLTPYLARQLITMLEVHVDERRSTAIPFHLQVLATLRFFAEGPIQKGVAKDYNHPMSQPSMCRSIERVLDAILMLENQFISFPRNREEREAIAQEFRRHIRIPGVIGLMDCLLVSCKKPSQNEDAYYNYKVGHALNVQVVICARGIVRNFCISPGSNTDRFIWQHCDLRNYLLSLNNPETVAQEGRYYLLADNGYTPSLTVLTPVLNAAAGSPEADYTEQHVRTRCRIEQTFGILTNMWMCIKRARVLLYRPEKIVRIITACMILHNFRLFNGLPMALVQQDINPEQPVQDLDFIAGINTRRNLINQYYN